MLSKHSICWIGSQHQVSDHSSGKSDAVVITLEQLRILWFLLKVIAACCRRMLLPLIKTLWQTDRAAGDVWPVQFSWVQGGIYELGKAHTRSTPSVRCFHLVLPESVPMFVWLTVTFPHAFKEDHQALPLSTPLSSKQSIVPCLWLVMVALPTSLSARSFAFTPSCPKQYICGSFLRVDAEHWHVPVWSACSAFYFLWQMNRDSRTDSWLSVMVTSCGKWMVTHSLTPGFSSWLVPVDDFFLLTHWLMVFLHD